MMALVTGAPSAPTYIVMVHIHMADNAPEMAVPDQQYDHEITVTGAEMGLGAMLVM